MLASGHHSNTKDATDEKYIFIGDVFLLSGRFR